MSLKKTAEDLLKIAEDIEKEAAEVTEFVCAKCNHTATLATVNTSRKTSAQEVGENVTVSEITVNDQISCPACEGVMAYSPTEASGAYYFDEKEAKEEEEKEEKEEEKEAAAHSEKTETPEEEAAESVETQKKEREQGKHASIDYDQLDRYLKG